MPTVKFSRSQFDSTFDRGGGSASLLFVFKSHKTFHHFDLYVLGEYLFLHHAAVISGAFWGLDSRSNGLLLVAQTARKILPSCMTSSLFSILLLHVKVVFYCTPAPGNEHLRRALGYAALSCEQHERCSPRV